MHAEKSYLSDILKKLEPAKKHKALSKLVYIGVWLAVVFAIIIMLQLLQRELISPVLLIFISLLIGGLLGVFISMKISGKYWPYLAKHINADTIKKRLDELKT